MNTGNRNCNSFRKGARNHYQKYENCKKNSPERTLRLLFCGTHCANFAMKPKNILPTAFPKMTSAALPSCVQQATRKANSNIRIRRQYENPYELSDGFGVLAGFSFVLRAVFAVPLTFGALGCHQ